MSETGSLCRTDEIKKVNSGGELKISEEEETTPFKDKVLGTSKLQEENSSNKGDAKASTPKKPEFLRMQSQIALPVVNKSE